jgi:YhcH/YjgK/YiaL family protein
MKKIFVIPTVMMACLIIVAQASAQTASTTWSKKAATKWFNKKEYLQGAAFTPHRSINKQEFARQYHLNKKYWDEAFAFMKDHDLASLAPGKYPIDGENVFATITEAPTKDFDKTGWESHRKYIDLQCVVTGEEKMGKYPVAKATVIKPYDEAKDLANYTAPGEFYVASAGTFLIFFPGDAHRPNITPGGNKVEKKLVIKIRAAE